MRGLLQRLSEVDSQAEAALRVIATFDALVQHRASFGALARTTAALVACPVGIMVFPNEACIRVDGAGKGLDPIAPPDHAVDVVVAGEPIASCWLEREGPPLEYDEIVLERLVVACASVWREHGAGSLSAAVEVVISPDTSERARAAALRQLGLDQATPIRVLSFGDPMPSGLQLDPVVRADVQRALDHRTPARTAVVGTRGAALLESHYALPVAIPGVALASGGVVPAIEAPLSWAQANSVLDLGVCLPLLIGPVSSVDEVGSLITLTAVPREHRHSNRDVSALEVLAAEHDEDLLCLEAFLATGSLRAAGKLLHRHHSSIASRLTRVADSLGIDLLTHRGASRALVALVLLRLDQLDSPITIN